MGSIRLHDWAQAVLNETIRADAEFQINQRQAWREFATSKALVNGVDVTAGFQHQRNLSMKELVFELDLVPDTPGLFTRLLQKLQILPSEPGYFYRLKKKGEKHPKLMHVKMVIRRDADDTYKSEVKLEPEDSKKTEEIHVAGIAR